MMMIPTPRSKVLLALCATQLVTLLFAAQDTTDKASCCSKIKECFAPFAQDPGKVTQHYSNGKLDLQVGTIVTNVRMIYAVPPSVEFVTNGQTHEILKNDWDLHFKLLNPHVAKDRRTRYMFNNRHFLGDGSGMWQGQRLSYACPKTYNDVKVIDVFGTKMDGAVTVVEIGEDGTIQEKISEIKNHLRAVRITKDLKEKFMTLNNQNEDAYSVWAGHETFRYAKWRKWLETDQYKKLNYHYEDELKPLVEEACAQNGIDLNFKGYTYSAQLIQRSNSRAVCFWHNDNVESGMIIYLNNNADGPRGTLFSSDLDANFSVQMSGEVGTGVLWNDRMLIHKIPETTDTTRTFLRVRFHVLRPNGRKDFGDMCPSKHRYHRNVEGNYVGSKKNYCTKTSVVLKQECDACSEMEYPLGSNLEWEPTESCSIQ